MFEHNPVPKPSFGRRIPKRKSRSEFSPKVRKIIFERDNYQCVRCGRKAEHIHHIIFRSALGGNDAANGVCVCSACHTLCHNSREVRKWFEDYRTKYLLGDGE
jgi:5-methylcytosine-specific restriction endonuclease McrA